MSAHGARRGEVTKEWAVENHLGLMTQLGMELRKRTAREVSLPAGEGGADMRVAASEVAG